MVDTGQTRAERTGMGPALVVFDLDGTLVDAFADIQAALNHGLRSYELPEHDLASVHRMVGNGLRVLCQLALPPGREDMLELVHAATLRYYTAHAADRARVYPGMADMLRRLRQSGLATAVLSNKADAVTQQIITALSLSEHLDAIQGAQPDVPLKPDPGSFLALRQRLNAGPAVIVGDGLPDVELARAAGVPFIGVIWGVGDADILAQSGPVAHTVEELEKSILDWAAALGPFKVTRP